MLGYYHFDGRHVENLSTLVIGDWMDDHLIWILYHSQGSAFMPFLAAYWLVTLPSQTSNLLFGVCRGRLAAITAVLALLIL